MDTEHGDVNLLAQQSCHTSVNYAKYHDLEPKETTDDYERSVFLS